MSNLKTYINQKYSILQLIGGATLFSIALLTVRIKLTHSFFFLFLVWNLFLAIIPFCISSYLLQKQNIHKLSLVSWLTIWLLFLPNSPYIITDLWHLRLASNTTIWLDMLIVFSFASTGLLLFYLSLNQIKEILIKYISRKVTNYLILFLIFLSAFGIYLGRFLRYNSWEIISNPLNLMNDILNIVKQPLENSKAYYFTIFLGTFLIVGHWFFNSFKIKKPHKNCFE